MVRADGADLLSLCRQLPAPSRMPHSSATITVSSGGLGQRLLFQLGGAARCECHLVQLTCRCSSGARPWVREFLSLLGRQVLVRYKNKDWLTFQRYNVQLHFKGG